MMKRWLFFGLALFVVSSCARIPGGVEPVTGFDLMRYLGTWYEIARLDHAFERDLVDVTADYTLQEDGVVRVVNRGRNKRTGEWEEAVGKAYLLESPDVGSLKVSFFGPFYGGYHVAKLEADYQMALVVGPNLGYAWILARTPAPDQALCNEFQETARQIGIEDDQWIWIGKCH